MPGASCLSDEQLMPLAVGEEPAGAGREHLQACSDCRQRLHRLEDEISTIRRACGESTSDTQQPESTGTPQAGPQAGPQPAAVPSGTLSGRTLGRYALLEKIGQGGMGEVYKARHERMGRLVAVKILPAAAMISEQAVRRFQREVRAAARLVHPNVVTAYDADEADGVHFLVSEYIDGTNLSSLVKREGPLPPCRAIDYVLQAARALQYAHDQGIVHRDVKPANLLLDNEGTVKVLDMGLARFEPQGALADAESDGGLTQTGQIMGSCDYMAPEQAVDPKTVDRRADIYSLGCTLFYLLTGRPVHPGETVLKSIVAHREEPIPRLRDFCGDVPEALDAVFQRMVAKEPDRRPASMDEVIAALRPCRVAEHAEPQAARPEAGIAGRRKRIVLTGVLAAAAALLLWTTVVKLHTPEGTLVVELNEPGATIEVFDEENRLEITRRSEEKSLSIAVEPGGGRLKVSKDGFELYTRNFTIASGGTERIKATLVPLAEGPSVAQQTPAEQQVPVEQQAGVPRETPVEQPAGGEPGSEKPPAQGVAKGPSQMPPPPQGPIDLLDIRVEPPKPAYFANIRGSQLSIWVWKADQAGPDDDGWLPLHSALPVSPRDHIQIRCGPDIHGVLFRLDSRGQLHECPLKPGKSETDEWVYYPSPDGTVTLSDPPGTVFFLSCYRNDADSAEYEKLLEECFQGSQPWPALPPKVWMSINRHSAEFHGDPPPGEKPGETSLVPQSMQDLAESLRERLDERFNYVDWVAFPVVKAEGPSVAQQTPVEQQVPVEQQPGVTRETPVEQPAAGEAGSEKPPVQGVARGPSQMPPPGRTPLSPGRFRVKPPKPAYIALIRGRSSQLSMWVWNADRAGSDDGWLPLHSAVPVSPRDHIQIRCGPDLHGVLFRLDSRGQLHECPLKPGKWETDAWRYYPSPDGTVTLSDPPGTVFFLFCYGHSVVPDPGDADSAEYKKLIEECFQDSRPWPALPPKVWMNITRHSAEFHGDPPPGGTPEETTLVPQSVQDLAESLRERLDERFNYVDWVAFPVVE